MLLVLDSYQRHYFWVDHVCGVAAERLLCRTCRMPFRSSFLWLLRWTCWGTCGGLVVGLPLRVSTGRKEEETALPAAPRKLSVKSSKESLLLGCFAA